MSLFVTFEGGEGSGKSSCLTKVAKDLQNAGYEVVITREPGGTPISEQIRNVILDKANTDMDPMTEALLYAASTWCRRYCPPSARGRSFSATATSTPHLPTKAGPEGSG